MALLAANPLERLDFWLTVGLLAVVLLAGAVILYATDVWRKREAAAPPDSLLTLNDYHKLFEAGELTEAEYAKVRDRLAGRKPPPQPLPGPPGPPDPTPGPTEKPADPV